MQNKNQSKSTFTIVLVQFARVHDRLVDGGDASRRNLPGVGVKLRRALYHPRRRPAARASGASGQTTPLSNHPNVGSVISQKVVSQIPVERSTEAQSLSTPWAVQLQVDPPPSAVILQLQANPCLQLGEHRGQLLNLHCI